MQLLAIDPGLQGGLAWMDQYTRVHCQPMPLTKKDQCELLYQISVQSPDVFCIMERVGYHFAGNNASSSAKFARHCGHLEGMLTALDIPYDEVTPAKWQMIIKGKPKPPSLKDLHNRQARAKAVARRKTVLKNLIKEQMQDRYPKIGKITLKVSDALGILTWAIEGRR